MPHTDTADALVHSRLAHWARCRPDACAIRLDALNQHIAPLSFAELQQRVQQQARQLQARAAPATCLLDAQADPARQLIEFLGVIASGRCAAVPDPDWPPAIHTQIEASLHALPAGQPGSTAAVPISPFAPFYIGFTSGSNGLPKGFRRHHRSWTESFRVTLQDFGPVAAGHVLAPGRLSHSLFLFGALLGLWTGAGVTLQQRFSAEQTIQRLQQGDCPVLIAVPNQLMLMLAHARRRRLPPIPALELLLISGARWACEQTRALRALFPAARIISFYGASETSYVSWMEISEQLPPQSAGRPFSNVRLHIGPRPGVAPAPADGPDLIWVNSPMLFSDYINSDDRTAARREGDWLSVRDIGHLDEQGMLYLHGRESRMIVTRAKNLFPEEIEARLMAHPAVAQASLHGLDDPLRGSQLHAVLQWEAVRPEAGTQAPGCPALAGNPSALDGNGDDDEENAAAGRASAANADTGGDRPPPRALASWCRQQLESFKTPRHWWIWQGEWPLTASGKTRHAAIADALQRYGHLDPQPPDSPLCAWTAARPQGPA